MSEKHFVYCRWEVDPNEVDALDLSEFHVSCGANVEEDGEEVRDEQWAGFFYDEGGAELRVRATGEAIIVTLIAPADDLLESVADYRKRDGLNWQHWLSPNSPECAGCVEANDDWGVYSETALKEVLTTDYWVWRMRRRF